MIVLPRVPNWPECTEYLFSRTDNLYISTDNISLADKLIGCIVDNIFLNILGDHNLVIKCMPTLPKSQTYDLQQYQS